MSISNNILAAFNSGVSTKQEDKLVLKELSDNDNFSELLGIFDEVDSIDGFDDLRNEFYETIDEGHEFNDFNINIK